MSVKIKGKYKGHGISFPTEIKKLFKPIRHCSHPEGGSNYSLAAWTDYLEDCTPGSLVFIALKCDLKHFKEKKPFIYVHHQFSKAEHRKIKNAKIGEQFTFACGCTYEVVPLSDYPIDVEFNIIITGHNVDER